MILADADLRSIQEARDLVRRSRRAWEVYRRFDQGKVDRICEAMARAGSEASERLARLAVEESGFGSVAGKYQKNRFCTDMLWESLRDLQTVGVVHRDDTRRYYQVAEPYGVVLAIVPVTNPTSTAMFKVLISLKARNSVVISPHPRAARCIGEAARVMAEAARSAGAPDDLVLCLTEPTLEGTHEAMRARETAVILATGGPDLVRAAYSMGKPAYGVGPGNAPAFIERTADVSHAVRAIVGSQMFDNSTICASEQSVVIDRPILEAVRAEFIRNKAHWCSEVERDLLARIVVQGRRVNPAIVGLLPRQIAELAGFEVPPDTTVLLVEESGVGWEHPLSVEKLSPILSVYVEDGWEAACDRCLEILEFGGGGHTLVIHSRDEEVIWTFVEEKPAHRVLVNAPASQGAVGYGTGLVPSMTLGCGAFGGNITSDNISAHNLLLVKHVGYCYDGFVESFPDFSRGPPTELAFVQLPAAPAPGVQAATSAGALGASADVAQPAAPNPASPVYQGNPTHPSSPFFGRPSGAGRPGVPPLADPAPADRASTSPTPDTAGGAKPESRTLSKKG
jgi:acetaldehyde dehydrogenase (acetylating)